MGKSFLDSLESEFAEASNDSGFGTDVTIVNPTDPESPDVQTIASMAGTSDYIVTKSEVSLLMTYYETAKFDLSLSYKALLKANRDFDTKLYSIKSALTGLNSVATRLEGVKSFTIKNEIALPKETVETMIATVKEGIADETERAIKDIGNMLRNTTDGDWRSSGDVWTQRALSFVLWTFFVVVVVLCILHKPLQSFEELCMWALIVFAAIAAVRIYFGPHKRPGKKGYLW
jgi:hypothetical protein